MKLRKVCAVVFLNHGYLSSCVGPVVDAKISSKKCILLPWVRVTARYVLRSPLTQMKATDSVASSNDDDLNLYEKYKNYSPAELEEKLPIVMLKDSVACEMCGFDNWTWDILMPLISLAKVWLKRLNVLESLPAEDHPVQDPTAEFEALHECVRDLYTIIIALNLLPETVFALDKGEEPIYNLYAFKDLLDLEDNEFYDGIESVPGEAEEFLFYNQPVLPRLSSLIDEFERQDYIHSMLIESANLIALSLPLRVLNVRVAQIKARVLGDKSGKEELILYYMIMPKLDSLLTRALSRFLINVQEK